MIRIAVMKDEINKKNPVGRPPKDKTRRTHRIQVRMSEEDFNLLEALRGDLSKNDYIIRAVRLSARDWPALR